MNRKGVNYDVGYVMGGNWRPVFDPRIVHRELEIIQNDLHCNAVRICGLDIDRLMIAAEDALKQGLEVWLSPAMWDKRPQKTLEYVVRAATRAEALRVRYPDKLVFLVGSELTLFMRGIIPGRTYMQRLRSVFSSDNIVRAGGHNKPLNEYLAKANAGVRTVFHGKVTYAALIWEKVDWNIFDFVGIDHYRENRIHTREKYIEMFKPLFSYGKPVVITEFGTRTYKGAEVGDINGITNHLSLFLHRIPIIGRFIQPRLRGAYIRDESLPARETIETLKILDGEGVDGAFVMTFVAPIFPHDENPLYDLDMDSFALVKTYADVKQGSTYPDMPWEPKEAFKAVADYYGR